MACRRSYAFSLSPSLKYIQYIWCFHSKLAVACQHRYKTRDPCLIKESTYWAHAGIQIIMGIEHVKLPLSLQRFQLTAADSGLICSGLFLILGSLIAQRVKLPAMLKSLKKQLFIKLPVRVIDACSSDGIC